MATITLEFISFLKCAVFRSGALVVCPVEDLAEQDLTFSEQVVDDGLALALEARPVIHFADEHVLEGGHDQRKSLSLFHAPRDYFASLLEDRDLLPSSLPSQPASPLSSLRAVSKLGATPPRRKVYRTSQEEPARPTGRVPAATTGAEAAPPRAPEGRSEGPFSRPKADRGETEGAPQSEWDGSDDDDTLDLGSVPEAQGDDAEDELLLGDEAPSSAPEPAPQEPEEQSAPQSGRRRGLVSGAEGGGKKPAPPLPQGGGTLFERMAKLSRSGAPDDEDDDDDDDGSSLNIPRFLGRQNNQ